MIKRFLNDSRGNVAAITAVTGLLLAGGVGAALDIRGASNLRGEYQDMADAAVLAAARSKVKNQAAMARIAQDVVDTIDTSGTSPVATTVLSDDKKYLTVRLDGQYENNFLAQIRGDTVDVASFAETVIEITRHTEIVLVLDTTRSTRYESRLDNLKTAANTFINTIDGIETDDKVRIAVVPFGQYVNVGLAQRNKPWLDVPADYTETFPPVCNMVRGPKTGETCTMGVTQPRPGRPAQPGQPAQPAVYGTCTDDGVTYSCVTTPARAAVPPRPAVPPYPGGDPKRICTPIYGPDRNQCTTRAPIRHVWSGCVGSRRNSANLDADYTNGEAKVPGFLDLTCAQELLPLTTDLGAARRKVNSLTTEGETYSAAGLMWGYRIVNYGEPFALARLDPDGRPPRRIVVFMTDGHNTRSRSGLRHNGTNRNDADTTSEDICQQMHDEPELEVYSVSFKVSDNKARRLIRNCASEDDMYYEASDGAKLNAAFEDIAFSLLNPRLTQ